MNSGSIYRAAAIGSLLGLMGGLAWLSPVGHRVFASYAKPKIAYAQTCSYISAVYTGSVTSPAAQISGVSANVGVNTPTYTCDTTYGDTKYWVGIEGQTGTCPYAAFAQAGWVMLGSPTPFYEEFNANDSPCYINPVTSNTNMGSSPSFQVNASTSLGGYCSTGGITHFYVNGLALGAVCSDWAYGPYVTISAERQEAASRLANMTFSNSAYCTYNGSTICAPNIGYNVASSANALLSDPCGIYSPSGTSFGVQDKRDLGQTC